MSYSKNRFQFIKRIGSMLMALLLMFTLAPTSSYGLAADNSADLEASEINRTLTIYKEWMGNGPESDVTFNLQKETTPGIWEDVGESYIIKVDVKEIVISGVSLDVKYRVVEHPLDDYTVSYSSEYVVFTSENENNSITIINTYTALRGTVIINKLWLGTDGVTSTTAAALEIEVRLLVNGVPEENTMVLNTENEWSVTRSNLSIEKTYTVQEVTAIPTFDVVYSAPVIFNSLDLNDSLTIRNIKQTAVVDDDNDDNDRTSTTRGNVVVEYVDEDGDELASDTRLSGRVGSDYDTTAKTINGYTLTVNPDDSDGSFTRSSITVTYVYSQDTDIGDDDIAQGGFGFDPVFETIVDPVYDPIFVAPATPVVNPITVPVVDPITAPVVNPITVPVVNPITVPVEEDDLLDGEVPLGTVLPSTGGIPAELFELVGGSLFAMGFFLKRRIRNGK